MNRRSRWFWAAVALQVLVLLGMTGMRAYTLATGTRVLLKTLPVDPRDLFRGDYVRLRYEISRLPVGQVQAAGHELRRGDVVWVLLAPGQPHWQAVAAGPRRPEPGPRQVAVQGRVQYREDGPEGQYLHVEYGIESFFVPEGEGRRLERPEIQLDVEAAVDRFGRAAIARVFADGNEVRFE